MGAMGMMGEIRRYARSAYGGAQRIARLTNFESLAVAQVEPSGVEMTRSARRYLLGYSAAVTGKANVSTVATTAAQWVIFNNEQASGATYYVEELGVYLTSGTPGVGGTLWACLYQAPTSSASDTGIAIVQAGGTTKDSRAVVASAVTITNPAAPVWFPVATNPSPNVTAFAASTYLEHRALAGRIAIPPQYGLGLYVLAPAGTSPLFAPFAMWSELSTENE